MPHFAKILINCLLIISLHFIYGCSGKATDTRGMELDIRGDTKVKNVTNEAISNEINELVNNCSSDCYIILSKNENSYLQAYFNEDKTFAVEFRENDENHHYSCTNQSIRADEVMKIFTDYNSQKQGWQNSTNWEKLDLK